jgi:transposase InsO family protein
VEALATQYIRETYGPTVPVPSYTTLWRVWREWFGTGRGRQKYARSKERVSATGQHVVISRPGQVVALDTTELAVLVRETVFGEPTPCHMTLALDAYSHSIVAFRLTLVSDTSTDVAMLLRDVMMPLPMRPDWGDDMEWPYPGVPASLVAEFAGHRVAALPFFAPETVTTDHGSVYKNHHLVQAQKAIGARILPSRVLRPTDKQAVERCFGAIQSLLLEKLPGWRGIDVADRGADPEGDAVLTLAEMEHLVATWVVGIWQRRELGEHAPAWDPGGRHSPNSLIAAAMEQGGFALQVPGPDLYYELLRSHAVGLYDRRGVKIRGLWYDGPVLDGLRGRPSGRGGTRKGTWEFRSDPRDRRFAFFRHPDDGQWHTLRWTGLPPDGEVPAFGDTRAEELLKAAKAAGLAPRTDAELLPVLLDLVGGRVPVSSWPTQMEKKKRTGHAREAAQGQAAASDRPRPAGPGGGTVLPLRPGTGWEQRAGEVAGTVDAERRRRRESAPPAPGLPGRLGASHRSRLAVPRDGEGWEG